MGIGSLKPQTNIGMIPIAAQRHSTLFDTPYIDLDYHQGVADPRIRDQVDLCPHQLKKFLQVVRERFLAAHCSRAEHGTQGHEIDFESLKFGYCGPSPTTDEFAGFNTDGCHK